MGSFIVEGGHNLKGEITPQGAKNEALQVICAVLLTEEEVIIDNIPDILDVNNLISLLKNMGVKVDRLSEEKYSFRADNIDTNYTQSNEFKKMSSSLRGSIMIVGPLLARFGEAVVPRPGGDKIGRRRLDTHFNSIMRLGAELIQDKENNRYNILVNHNASNTVSNVYNHGLNVFNNNLDYNVTGKVLATSNNCICNQENQIINMNDGKSTICPNLLNCTMLVLQGNMKLRVLIDFDEKFL